MSKPFTNIMLRDLITQYDREEISLSRFKEILNERAEQWHTEQTRWIPTSERLPTKEDADDNGKVLVYRKMNPSQKALEVSVLDYSHLRYCDPESMWRRIMKP